MKQSPDELESRLKQTLSTAVAFVEDFEYILDVIGRSDTPSRSELRRLSAILRRWLLDGDLSGIAGPRIGKFNILSPDNNPVYKAERDTPYPYFESCGVSVFGIWIRAAMMERSNAARNLVGFNPEATIPLRLDNFISQRVICIEGKWITRKSVIKYVANKCSGVHSDKSKEPDELLLDRVRNSVSYSLREGSPAISFNLDALTTDLADFKYDADSIDPVLLEQLSVAFWISQSPDIQGLVQYVRDEVASK